MTISKVTSGVWRAGTAYVNWYMIDAGKDGVTLVDAGLPAYIHQLDESLQQIGRTRNDVRALALTRGHIDHSGMAAALAELGTTIYLRPPPTPISPPPPVEHHPAEPHPLRLLPGRDRISCACHQPWGPAPPAHAARHRDHRRQRA